MENKTETRECLEKNVNASRLSEHFPVRGKTCQSIEVES